jgi:hypothetical protein
MIDKVVAPALLMLLLLPVHPLGHEAEMRRIAWAEEM